jgi:uncharacterized protein YgiM (DUF1202 family)
MKVLLVVIMLGAVAWPSAGHAEKVRTNQPTKMYSRAGEHAPVLLTIKAGQTMTVLAKDGRWLKVRVSGRTGWIPRSKVDMPEDDDVARNTRRRPFVDGRGTKRGFGGEAGPEDRVGADATGDSDEPKHGKPARASDADEEPVQRKPARASDADEEAKPRRKSTRDDNPEDKPARKDDEPDKEPARPVAHVSKKTTIYSDPSEDSRKTFTADPRTALTIGETKGKWTFVETDEGDAGYVQTSRLDVEQSDADAGPRTRALSVRARLGITLVKQSVSTPGGTLTPPDNYSASSSSITIALGASALYPVSKDYWLGAEGNYDFDKAVPGISYMAQTTSFSLHNLNLRALAGYDLHKPNGMIVFGRLGYHYESFQVANYADFTKNTAKLPSQILKAPTLGAALAIPRLTSDLGLRLSLDTILVGATLEQTKNLEDGTGPSAKAVFLGGSLTYRWKSNMDLQATYDLAYTSKSFSGTSTTSTRGHTGTGTPSGSDFNNAVSVGIAYAF